MNQKRHRQEIWKTSFGYMIPTFDGDTIISLSVSEYVPIRIRERVISKSDSSILSLIHESPIPNTEDLPGTPFMHKVWSALLEIPFGETRSYSDIAERAGHPKAVRATGTAIGRNPIAFLIPCHRVLAKDGSIGGFAWGVGIKRKILKWEKEMSKQIEK